MDRVAAADQPGAQSAEKPDRRQCEHGIIMTVPEQEHQQNEQRQSIREQMGRTRVEQRTEYDSGQPRNGPRDRKSTRLNSSHSQISYADFCLKKIMSID